MILHQYLRRALGGAPLVEATVTMLGTRITSTISDFLNIIDLEDMPAEFWGSATESGDNILLTDASDITLPYFLFDFDKAAQKGYAFVSADIAGATDLVIKVAVGGETIGAPNSAATLVRHHFLGLCKRDNTFVDVVSGKEWIGDLGTRTTNYLPATSCRFTSGLLNGTDPVITEDVGHAPNFVQSGFVNTDTVGDAHRNWSTYSVGTTSDVYRFGLRSGFPDWINGWNNGDSWFQAAGVMASGVDVVVSQSMMNTTTARYMHTNGVRRTSDGTTGTVPTNIKFFSVGHGVSGQTYNGYINHMALEGRDISDAYEATFYNSRIHRTTPFYTVT